MQINFKTDQTLLLTDILGLGCGNKNRFIMRLICDFQCIPSCLTIPYQTTKIVSRYVFLSSREVLFLQLVHSEEKIFNYVQGTWPISWRSLVGLTLIWDVPPPCPPAQPVLPISHQPRQNQAEGGTAKIKVNPTQVRQEMGLPVS